MSRSHLVDERYRLRESDLGGRTRRVVIDNISFQGVEELRAVLHLQGMPKRMVLSAAQCKELIRISGSVELADWVGKTIELQSAGDRDAPGISIQEVGQADDRRAWRLRDGDSELSGWLIALVVVASSMALSLYYASQHLDAIRAALQALTP